MRDTKRPDAVARLGSIIVDFAGAEVYKDAIKIRLTAHELKVLRYFIDNPGRVICRHELLDKVWGYNAYPTTRTVDNQILKLRQKLELNPKKPSYFITVHGIGYKFVHRKFQSGRLAKLQAPRASIQIDEGWESECDSPDLRDIVLRCLSVVYATNHPETSRQDRQSLCELKTMLGKLLL
jgi:DNA-binding winged helix-turn-helix (wHTH) protein